MADYRKIASTSELKPGECKSVQVGERYIALCNVDGAFYAMENACPHQGGPLGEGFLEGAIVTCPWHAWRFDVTSGVCQLDDSIKQPSFPTKVEGNDVFVAI